MYKKTKTLGEPVSPEIAAFSVVMENKLQREGFGDVGEWEGIPIPFLIRQLESKIRVLKGLDADANPSEVFAKAAVIGTVAMMLAELTARKRKKPFDLRDESKSDIILTPRMVCANGTSRGEPE
jgi:hypothetical protein